MASFFCEKCRKTMNETQFYTYKDGRKTEMCKKCLTMHIDNFNPETYLWLLEKMDVPYIPSEWNTLLERAYAKDPSKLNGMSVFGKYLSKMKLKQFKDFGWADSARLQEEEAVREQEKADAIKQREEEIQERYDNGEISEAEYKTLTSANAQEIHAAVAPRDYSAFGIDKDGSAAGPNSFFNEDDFLSPEDLPDPAAELTEEDKVYLAMKWGRLYKPSEWIELEKTYNEMEASFDIQDADTINTLILICKTNLKMNQALDQGDLDGFQKLSRVSESLRKSAKFTAAQKKDEKTDFVDCVGEIVAICEKQGFIPRFATDIPQDKVDATLKDMNNYIRKLVTQDLGFGQQIEDSLKKIQIQKEMHDHEEAAALDEDNIEEMVDRDIEEFYSKIEEQKQKDKEIYEEEE